MTDEHILSYLDNINQKIIKIEDQLKTVEKLLNFYKDDNFFLIESVKNKNIDKFKQILENGANINTSKINGKSILSYLIHNNMIDFIKLLIEKKYQLNFTIISEDVLSFVICNKYIELAYLLIENFNITIYNSILLNAIEFSNNIEFIKYLIIIIYILHVVQHYYMHVKKNMMILQIYYLT